MYKQARASLEAPTRSSTLQLVTAIGVVMLAILPPMSRAAAARGQAVDGPIALVGGTLIDGVSRDLRRSAVVLLRDGRIERVGTVGELAVPDGYTRISADGQTILPGLWDMHVHVLYAGHTDIQYWHRTYTARYERDIMPATARQLLMAGVTSARDMGAPPDAIFALERRIASGELDGPTIYAAGPQLTHVPPDWAQQYRWATSGPADASAKATQLLDRGADLLKVTDAQSMTGGEIQAIAAAAHARGKLVSAHGRTDAEIRLGLAAGVDDFQHVGTAAVFPDDLVAAIRARATSGLPLYWTPTVGLPLSADAPHDDVERPRALADTAGLPVLIADDVQRAIRAYKPPPSARETIVAKVRQLRDARVEFLVGTDGGLPGASHSEALWREMDAWVRVLQIDPMETIRRATSVAARAAGAARESGSIEPGKRADLIVVNGNPLESMRPLRNPAVVIKDGRRVK
jgi:imidazolonepropionase-like amidohydrolase